MIVLTGHAGGIGRALALALSNSGHEVLGIDTSSAPELATAELQIDLAQLDNEKAQRQLEDQLGSALAGRTVEGLINNAAWQCVGPASAATAPELLRSFQINAVAPLMLFRALAPALRAAGGIVINITSVHTLATKAGFGAYAASKAALGSLTRTLALEEAASVRVIEVRPGAVATPMLEAGFKGREADRRQLDEFQPAGRIAAPQDFADLIVKLLEADSFSLSGAVLTVDGGIHYRLHDPS